MTEPTDNLTDTHPTPRQTKSYIKDLLRTYGLMPKAKMGQNFLIDLNLMDLILASAELTDADSVLEVGTGTGGLTGRLSDAAGAVTSVELDPDFHKLAKELLYGRKNLQLIFGDILAGKNELRPTIMQAWQDWSAQHNCTRRKLIANLPYAVATPVIANLLTSGIPMERMVVMVQWEVGDRLAASPGTKDYGALSVLVQSIADVKIIRRLSPSTFWPEPAVDSAIVQIQPNPEKLARMDNIADFRLFLRDLYTHRRKNIRHCLVHLPERNLTKEIVDSKLAQLEIEGSLRAETLSIDQHKILWKTFTEN